MGCVYPQVTSLWSDYPRLLLRVASLMPLSDLFTREGGVYPQVTSLRSDFFVKLKFFAMLGIDQASLTLLSLVAKNSRGYY